MLNHEANYKTSKGDLIVFFVQYYNLNGSVLTEDLAFEKYGVPRAIVREALKDPDFQGALEEQGVVFKKAEGTWTNHSLTAKQLLVANSLMDMIDSRSDKKKLQDMGVSTAQYNAWLKDPIFKDYIHQRADQMMGEFKHEVSTALRDRIRAGDLKAIEYYNEMMGIYTRPRSNSYGLNGMDVQAIIVEIIEIIDLRVLDPDIKVLVAEDLKNLITKRQLAQGIVQTASPVGELEGPTVQGQVLV